MIRLAAVGDVHAGTDSEGAIRADLLGIDEQADVLLLAGDLTTQGLPEEAAVLANELRDVPIPIVAVLGNHDHHSDRPDAVREHLERVGVTILERGCTVLHTPGGTLGVVGAKGFGGGFIGASATEFGEPEMKAFVRETKGIAHDVERSLRLVDADARVLLLHYAPIPDTLLGEPPEIFPFLGSYLLGEAADRAGADLILHGHAHRGVATGTTPGGIPVRNVARPVLRKAYGVFTLDASQVSGDGTRRDVIAADVADGR